MTSVKLNSIALLVALLVASSAPMANAQPQADCNANTIPDECDVDCGQTAGPCDVVGCGQSDDCNENGMPDECEPLWDQEASLLTLDGAGHDLFGNSVAISGDVAVVGADWDSNEGDNPGSAHVFRWDGSTWTPEAKLLPDDGVAWILFGNAVAVSGDVAVVGAYFDDEDGEGSGAAYVFRKLGPEWVQEAKLLADDGYEWNHFGCSVAVSGDVAIIGAHRGRNGAAYVFRRSGSTWIQEFKLLPDDGARGAQFGRSLALSGSVAVIGARYDSMLVGSAHVFRYDGSMWEQEAKLLPDDGATGDWFGFSVDLSGDVAVIGAKYGDDDNGVETGSAYIFRSINSNWIQEAKLLPADGKEWGYFGASVAISGNTVLVGAHADDPNGAYSGSVHIFRKSGPTWIREAKLLPDDAAAYDQFGRSVAISGEVALIGTPEDDDNGDDAGSAYVFSLSGSPDCNVNEVPDDCDIIDGTSTDMNSNGVPDECERELADLDGDFDCDSYDYAIYLGCFAGPDADYSPGCEWADLEGDGDVDFIDFGLFQAAFTQH